MIKSNEIKENTIKVTFQMPEGLHDQIIARAGTLMKKRKTTVTKTDVAIELIKIGLLNVK